MAEINQNQRASAVIQEALECSRDSRHEFVMPEHLLFALTEESNFTQALNKFSDSLSLQQQVAQRLKDTERVPDGIDYEPEMSAQMERIIEIACQQVYFSSAKSVDITHLVMGLLHIDDSWACYLLKNALNGADSDFISELINECEMDDFVKQDLTIMHSTTDDIDYELDDDLSEDNYWNPDQESKPSSHEQGWRRLVTCMNDLYDKHNPLIGRERELQRTMMVLCRLDKNNPLHVGEPGVGKTALVWGLARLIAEGRVPRRLKHSRIYQLDMGTLLAGTQYRGDFENRIKLIMDGILEESRQRATDGQSPCANIVYIDEIHTLVGAGATSDSSMDASNMLKPYLETGDIRFIGSTTYEEYNRYFMRSKGIVRRFQQIDIDEPTPDEAKHILRQLCSRYETFHGVTYSDEALDFAVDASAKYVNDRFLPDKAIDLIDEAGAAYESKKLIVAADAPEWSTNTASLITKADIADVLAKTCKVDALAVSSNTDTERLKSLKTQLSAQIYGQDEAIRQVTEAVLMSRAGLLDEGKPLASLLFVGPTGVGKTEVARVLAHEMGIELLRFDMSEYTEKHTVAKLIGSPAGYVGYEDGGLLTDAVRKTPHCVLLLDEIEKAHQDIYNILLQVMDYARLTDNKGRKADFRNVILIMTSNAGAQYAAQASVGFTGSVSRGEAMLRQVKKTFKPEFINRLSATVVFNDMDVDMARLILRKKLNELQQKLTARHVVMTVSDDAFNLMLNAGFTREYGAREMDRVISQRLKPLLMHELLFGSLQQGGNVTVAVSQSQLIIQTP